MDVNCIIKYYLSVDMTQPISFEIIGSEHLTYNKIQNFIYERHQDIWSFKFDTIVISNIFKENVVDL